MNELQIKQFRQSEHDVDPIYLNRWSPRSFSEKEVPEDVLMRVFEAARWAPSAINLQPWRFIIARSEEDRAKFNSFILDGNRRWCEKAPVLAVLISDKEDPVHAFDSGTAWGFLALQAAKEGLVTHAMGGYEKDKAREVLNIPDNFDLQIVIAIGYQGEKEALPEDLQGREQPSTRRPLNETIFEGTFK
ncbi:nitroreductase family protein [Ureibacillus chungkukjangi]|uniref:Nitroreductase n=1 Tax=Ureibacillus chungkukjangi TaxID=1202712 RepID=A0A318TLJ2_9BACL|nr:nitroreductase family protein [Ureibacillus chungkukjangi]MCM3387824.1 nitroreductase family protein [Ureibacillus chungkukjangi]PYF05701.1 nitroreductase [Ureibacillus chungkukjangi]